MQPGAPQPPPGYGWAPQPNPMPGYYGGPMKSQTPKTLGLLSMIFGGLVAAFSLIGLVAGKTFTSFSVRPSQREAFERYLDKLHTYSMVQSAVMLLMSLALVYIGSGQRGYKKWAVNASVLWGVVGLVVVVGQLIGAFSIAMPALDEFTRDISHGRAEAEAVAMGAKIGAFIGIAFYAPYPIILISAFRKPHNVAAMDG